MLLSLSVVPQSDREIEIDMKRTPEPIHPSSGGAQPPQCEMFSKFPDIPMLPPNNNKLPPHPQSSIRSIPFQPEPSSPTNPLCPNIQMPLRVVGIVCVCGVVFFKSLLRISLRKATK